VSTELPSTNIPDVSVALLLCGVCILRFYSPECVEGEFSEVELRRTSILGTSVKGGKRKGRGHYYAPALIVL
jgi:hypothetical protein